MRRCYRCGATKPLTEFHRCRRAPDGAAAACKPCKTAMDRAAYAKDGETARARSRAYHAANRELHAQYRRDHAARIQEYARDYYLKHPEKFVLSWHRRRARLAGGGGTHTAAEWRAKCADFGHRCAYCGADGLLTKDHDLPVSRGGSNDILNIVPACGPCNLRKRTRTGSEFRVFLARTFLATAA